MSFSFTRAAGSPWGLVAAGAGVAVGLLIGLGPLAIVTGALGWAAGIAFSVTARNRGAKPAAIDPFALTDPWRRYVKDAQQARSRFDRVVASTRPGPLHDRLVDIATRMDAGIAECWRIAVRGHEIDGARRSLEVDTKNARYHLERIERGQREHGASDDTSASTAQALRSQLAADERMAQIARDAATQLRLLDARFDEAVARATELSLSGDQLQLARLSDEVNDAVTEMEALRQALEEVSQPPGSAPGQSQTQ